jgi:hypothetical protein
VVKLSKKAWKTIALVGYWAVTFWLLYPLIFKIITPLKAGEYFVRSALGVTLLILIFGKTFFDLLFPMELSKARNRLNWILLSVYTTIMAGGIIFMLVRILALYLNENADTYTGGGIEF